MNTVISPSMLACDFLHLQDETERAEKSGADWLHLDVMDGVFVPNISFGFDIIKCIHSVTKLPLDVHMMTVQPQKYLQVLKEAGATFVTVHNDFGLSVEELADVLKEIRSLGMRPSVSVRPKISVDEILPLLPLVDMALVMTVEPGFGGQKFMPDMMDKVRELRAYADGCGREFFVQVDGGINPTTAVTAAKAGADSFVVGSAAFHAPDMAKAIADIRSAIDEAKK